MLRIPESAKRVEWKPGDLAEVSIKSVPPGQGTCGTTDQVLDKCTNVIVVDTYRRFHLVAFKDFLLVSDGQEQFEVQAAYAGRPVAGRV